MTISQVSRLRPTLAGLAMALGLGAAPAVAASVMPLASHRAVYDLTLADATGDHAPANASGRIAFEFTGSACEGYVMNFRQVTDVEPTDGESRVTDMRSSTFEGGDAKAFRFRTATSVNGQDVETIEGSANKSKNALAISLTQPERSSVDVGQGVAFPTEQIERIIAAGEAGEHILPMKVFDGSDTGKKIYNTLAVIGAAATKPPTDKAAQSEPLRSMRRWPVTVSYFDEHKLDSAPDYVLGFDLYENGVSGSLKLNYGDFALRGELTHFDLLHQKGC